MPKIIKKLTRKEIEARPSVYATSSKPEVRNDGNGLALLVYPSGTRSWRSRYNLHNKRCDYIFAKYDEINEIQARERNQQHQALAKQNIDPKSYFNDNKFAKSLTFALIAQEWLEFREHEHRKDKEHIRRLNKHVLPKIGNISHHEITKQFLQDNILNPIIENGTYEEAKRTKTTIKQILDFAIDKYELIDSNVAEKLQVPKHKVKSFPAITEEHNLKDFLKAVWKYEENHPRSNLATNCLLKISILLALRPSEIRCLKWEQYNKEENILYAFASKVDVEHPIKLPRQAIEILDKLEKHKKNEYMFPTNQSKPQPLSEGACRTVLKKIGYKDIQTMHGLRAVARTILDEELGEETKYLESQLTHKNNDRSRGAYNRSKYLKPRARILQKWADYIDALRNDENVSRFKPIENIDAEKTLDNIIETVGVEKVIADLISNIGEDEMLKIMLQTIDKDKLETYLNSKK